MDYKQKYLKYKNKYLQLKNQYGGETNWRIINEQLDRLPKEEYKYFTKKGFVITFTRISDNSIFKLTFLDFPNLPPEISINGNITYRSMFASKFGEWNSDRQLDEIITNKEFFPNVQLLLVNTAVSKYNLEMRKKQALENILFKPVINNKDTDTDKLNINLI